MKSFLLIMVSFCASLIAEGPCKTTKNIMDCKGKGLTDCPVVVESVTVLILDENNLTDLRTKNCKNWTNLISLSVRKNKLKKSLTFEKFKVLGFLDLSENQLRSLALSGVKLSVVNVSRNFFSGLEVNLPNVQQQLASNSRKGKLKFDYLLVDLHKSPSLTILDVSRNRINFLSDTLRTFINNKNLTINLSSKPLSSVNLDNVVEKKLGFNIDISFNQIAEIDIDSKYNFDFHRTKNDETPAYYPSIEIDWLPSNSTKNDETPTYYPSIEIDWLLSNSTKNDDTTAYYPSKEIEWLPKKSTKNEDTPAYYPSKEIDWLPSYSTKNDDTPAYYPSIEIDWIPRNSTKNDDTPANSPSKDVDKLPNDPTKNDDTTANSSSKTRNSIGIFSSKHSNLNREILIILISVSFPFFGFLIIFGCCWAFCRHRNNNRKVDEQNQV